MRQKPKEAEQVITLLDLWHVTMQLQVVQSQHLCGLCQYNAECIESVVVVTVSIKDIGLHVDIFWSSQLFAASNEFLSLYFMFKAFNQVICVTGIRDSSSHFWHFFEYSLQSALVWLTLLSLKYVQMSSVL